MIFPFVSGDPRDIRILLTASIFQTSLRLGKIVVATNSEIKKKEVVIFIMAGLMRRR